MIKEAMREVILYESFQVHDRLRALECRNMVVAKCVTPLQRARGGLVAAIIPGSPPPILGLVSLIEPSSSPMKKARRIDRTGMQVQVVFYLLGAKLKVI
jgi:hypothetical protein